jgi:hypothetical protein
MANPGVDNTPDGASGRISAMSMSLRKDGHSISIDTRARNLRGSAEGDSTSDREFRTATQRAEGFVSHLHSQWCAAAGRVYRVSIDDDVALGHWDEPGVGRDIFCLLSLAIVRWLQSAATVNVGAAVFFRPILSAFFRLVPTWYRLVGKGNRSTRLGSPAGMALTGYFKFNLHHTGASLSARRMQRRRALWCQW